jgi:glyceraldehyde 3-phosphate dehydrogenase
MSGKVKVAINGFGRIGRNVARSYFKYPERYKEIDLVAINDITDFETLRHLFKYDSVHGKFEGSIKLSGDTLEINNHKIKLLAHKDLKDLPWKALGVDVVIESTGLFLTKEQAQIHVASGAKKVIISAPSKNEVDATVVLGVNDKEITKDKVVYSNASCTTNCLAPMVKVLEDNFGVESGFMVTVHSYTKDQSIVDSPHKDLRRARAAAVSIIPTTTGATRAVELVLPNLKGKLAGYGIRVPVPDGSITDFTAVLKKPATKEQINEAFKKASEGELKNILEYANEPIVSIDIVGNPYSTIFDSALTQVIEKATHPSIRVVGWYDNEWGYSNRTLDLCIKVGQIAL